MLRIYSVLLHKAKVSTTNQIHILHSFPARDRKSLMTVNSTNCWLNGGSGRDEERGCGGSQLELKRLLSYISSIHRQLALQNGTITAPHLLQHQTHKHPHTLSEKAREIYADIKSQHLHTWEMSVSKGWTDCQSFLNPFLQMNFLKRQADEVFSIWVSNTKGVSTWGGWGQDWTQGALGNIAISVRPRPLSQSDWSVYPISTTEPSTFCAMPVLASFALNWMCQLDAAADWKYFWTDSLHQRECCGYEWWCF